MVQMLARAVRDMNPLGDQLEEMRGAARRAIGRAANAVVTHLEESKDRVAPAPASLSLSRAYSPLRHGRFAAMIPGDSAVETVITSGLFSTLNIYNTLLIGRLILTWCVAFGAEARRLKTDHRGLILKRRPTRANPRARHERSPIFRSPARIHIFSICRFPNPPRQIVYPLATLCDPYLNLFRGIIPPIGGTIDLSPILAFTVLNVFTNTAAALPCEMNEDGTVKAPEPKRSPGAMLRERFAKQRAARAEKDAKKN
jgi:YggT family protein